jgi:hypothetical protein
MRSFFSAPPGVLLYARCHYYIDDATVYAPETGLGCLPAGMTDLYCRVLRPAEAVNRPNLRVLVNQIIYFDPREQQLFA